MSTPLPNRPGVVIVGGGMGGIQAAKTLATAPVDITLVNPHNYYLFQPLIYEVANALLQAEDVAHSIRGMLRYLPILPAFHPRMQRAAQRMLMRRGVRVRLRSPVAQAGPASVTLTDGLEIPAGMIVWAAGVRATPLADSLALPQAPDGRILVQPNLSLPGHPEAFAIGDMAALPLPAGGLHPALAQFAIQGGRHAAREIMRHIGGAPSRPFRYRDKGMTASVGRDGGIVQTGHIRFSGRLAFFAWGVLHSLYVPGWRDRLSIDLNWLWSYVTHRRAALMLIGETPTAHEQLGSWPPPAVETRPELDNSHHRDIPGDERRTPPSGQALGTPRLRAAAQVPEPECPASLIRKVIFARIRFYVASGSFCCRDRAV